MPEQEGTVFVAKVDLAAWREEKRADQSIYLKRQASEVILFAIALCPELQPYLLLKGGTLMGVAYSSPRQTVDIDFTMTTRPADIDEDKLRVLLHQSIKHAGAALGYDLLELAVQHLKWAPKPKPQIMRSFPALNLKIGYAKRGTNQHKLLLDLKAATFVEIDISFNEPQSRIQVLELDRGLKLFAYSWIELIAEKIRALLQQLQPGREKSRRQDIYDIDRLITNIDIGAAQKREMLLAIKQKCVARNILPTFLSFDDPELKSISGREWKSLEQELEVVPDFDACFARVADFYRSLPWPSSADIAR